ncbi:MAG: hypothetical protein E7488_00470 [Ruminococcaceae bacterium]|nr:hypothetical protein [Oscillospiraceae bacterium]
MFGYVQANLNTLTDDEKARYRQFYCGLCHTLGQRHSDISRFGLTYDMTFLAILLSSLYEPKEEEIDSVCIVHPFRKQRYIKNRYIDYAADMTVALVYFKCEDDWHDDNNIISKSYSTLLSNAYKKVKISWPVQCDIIEKELKNLAEIEKSNDLSPDAAANCFGRLMSGLFVYREDIWSDYLCRLGYGLGRYIYLSDATADLEKDKRKGSYNPLINISENTDDFTPMLKNLLGEASQCFEMLPLIQDENILKNIIYSGIWNKYNHKLGKGET